MVRSKEAKQMIKKIREAGGEVEDLGQGKIRVTGPKGTAMVGDNVTAGRALKATYRTIERYTGLEMPR